MSRDRFEPVQYCVMAMGGSAMAHAFAGVIGTYPTFLIGMAVVVMSCRDLTRELMAGKDFDFVYLRVGGALLVYLVYTWQIARDPEGHSALSTLIAILCCCFLLPVIELVIRWYTRPNHSKPL